MNIISSAIEYLPWFTTVATGIAWNYQRERALSAEAKVQSINECDYEAERAKRLELRSGWLTISEAHEAISDALNNQYCRAIRAEERADRLEKALLPNGGVILSELTATSVTTGALDQKVNDLADEFTQELERLAPKPSPRKRSSKKGGAK